MERKSTIETFFDQFFNELKKSFTFEEKQRIVDPYRQDPARSVRYTHAYVMASANFAAMGKEDAVQNGITKLSGIEFVDPDKIGHEMQAKYGSKSLLEIPERRNWFAVDTSDSRDDVLDLGQIEARGGDIRKIQPCLGHS